MKLATDNEFYNKDKILKITHFGDKWSATLDVMINIRGEDIYIQKQFDNFSEDELSQFFKIDDKLYVNLKKIIKITFYEDKGDYCFMTSLSKKRIYSKFLNYNIKVSGQNERIIEYLKGEKMWIERDNNFYNSENINNIVYDFDRLSVILNFKNTESNKENVENVRPSYEIENFKDSKELYEFVTKLTSDGRWVKVGNRFINLDNVYNIKINDDNTVYFNFTSNITKNLGGKKVISTEFVKCECSQTTIKDIVKKLNENNSSKDAIVLNN